MYGKLRCKEFIRAIFVCSFLLDETEDKEKGTLVEELVVVKPSIPVSVKPFGEIQLQLPVKEENLPSEKKLEVS